MIIIDGRKIRDEILEQLQEEIKNLQFVPVFCDVLVGADPASEQYVRMKNKTAEKIGIETLPASFSESITTEALVAEIEKLNTYPHISGLIVQLPLPEHIDEKKVLDAIDPTIDVDCIGKENSELFYAGKPGLAYPTALAVMEILNRTVSDLPSKKIAIIGKGNLVGKPVATLLINRNIVPIVIDRSVADIGTITREADILISAAGKGGLVHGDMVKDGAVVIDAGTSESYGSIVGDVVFEEVKERARALSPVPGGVGPLTVAMLFRNVVEVAKRRAKHNTQ